MGGAIGNPVVDAAMAITLIPFVGRSGTPIQMTMVLSCIFALNYGANCYTKV
jgi:hypothetical protein